LKGPLSLYGFTKATILEYYRRIATFIMPHLKGRALTLKRYPRSDKAYFFEKRCPSHRPAWAKTMEVRRMTGADDSLSGQRSGNADMGGNLASLELHVPLARAGSLKHRIPLSSIWDPGDGANILDCAEWR